MKIRINKDERYPDYSFWPTEDDTWGELREIDLPTFERWQKALEDYNEAQREIGKLLENK